MIANTYYELFYAVLEALLEIVVKFIEAYPHPHDSVRDGDNVTEVRYFLFLTFYHHYSIYYNAYSDMHYRTWRLVQICYMNKELFRYRLPND